jgi:hypothetical protein
MPFENSQQFNNQQQQFLAQSMNVGNQMGNNGLMIQNRSSENFNLFGDRRNSMDNSNNFNNNSNNNNNFNNNNFNNNNNYNNNNFNNNQNNNMNNFNNNNNNFNNNNNNNFNNNFNNNNNQNINMNNPMNINNNFNNNSQNNNMNLNNNFNNNNNNFNNNFNNNNNNNLNNLNMMDNNQLKLENQSQFTYDLIMYLKEKTDDILMYNEKHGLRTIKLGQSSELKFFPPKSRFVNLGTSVLLAGGEKQENNNKIKLSKCYLITLMEDESANKYEVNVMPYGPLKEPRERHNLLFLPNKHFVFACSGFYSKTCEYTDIYKGEWEMIGPLHKARGNASMAYVNERYVYILGGFELEEKAQGNYLNDIEYFDINNFAKGWTVINFVNNRGVNTSLTALGIVPITKNIFLICGGYDGKEYKSNVYKVDCNNHEHPTIEETSSLGKNSIFIHNMFCKIKKSYFNFDMQGQMFGFDYENWRFGILNSNANK